MAIINSNLSACGLVEKYVGTAYDHVKHVSDNMDAIDTIVKLDEEGTLQEVADLSDDITVAAALINYKGAWEADVQYVLGDSVSHNDLFWMSNGDNINSEPTSENTDWKEILATNIATIETYADFPSGPSEADVIIAQGMYAIGDEGWGIWAWDGIKNKAEANLGTILDPEKPFTLIAQGTGVGIGCWIRLGSGEFVSPEMFGARGTGYPTDDTEAIQATLDYAGSISFKSKSTYYIAQSVKVRSRSVIDFNGCIFDYDTTIPDSDDSPALSAADDLLFELESVSAVIIRNGTIVRGHLTAMDLGVCTSWAGISIRHCQDVLVEGVGTHSCRYGFSVTGGTDITLRKCVSEYSMDDGYNFGGMGIEGPLHPDTDTLENILIDNCVSRYSGYMRLKQYGEATAGFEINDTYVNGITFVDCVAYKDGGMGFNLAHNHGTVAHDGSQILVKNVKAIRCRVTTIIMPDSQRNGFAFTMRFENPNYDFENFLLESCYSEFGIPIMIYANSGGYSRNIRINNCTFRVDYENTVPRTWNNNVLGFIFAPDDFVGETTPYTENILVSNCEFEALNTPVGYTHTTHSAESIERIVFDNCNFYGIQSILMLTYHDENRARHIKYRGCRFNLVSGGVSIIQAHNNRIDTLVFDNCVFDMLGDFTFMLNDHTGTIKYLRIEGCAFAVEENDWIDGWKVNNPEVIAIYRNNYTSLNTKLSYIFRQDAAVTDAASISVIGNIFNLTTSAVVLGDGTAAIAEIGNIKRVNGVVTA